VVEDKEAEGKEVADWVVGHKVVVDKAVEDMVVVEDKVVVNMVVVEDMAVEDRVDVED